MVSTLPVAIQLWVVGARPGAPHTLSVAELTQALQLQAHPHILTGVCREAFVSKD